MEKDIRLAILPYGWVFVGEYSHVDGKHMLHKTKNVRRSYTGKGMCDLANTGPNDQVTLDEANTIEFEEYVALVHCDASKWEKVLG